MIRHDLQLWAYASKELELGDHRFVEAHLEDCPECVEQLAAVQVAKEALELAREARPQVGWARVDERIGAMVEKRLRGAGAAAPLLSHRRGRAGSGRGRGGDADAGVAEGGAAAADARGGAAGAGLVVGAGRSGAGPHPGRW